MRLALGMVGIVLQLSAYTLMLGQERLRLVIPRQSAQANIGGTQYVVHFDPALLGPVRSDGALRIVHVASETTCGDAEIPGSIAVNTDLTPMQQAKGLIHETVHIAETCDKRNLPVDERIAEDVSDLFDSPEGPFVVKELSR
jgi:hypothetical protein